MADALDVIEEKLRKQAPQIANLAMDVVRTATTLPKASLEEYIQTTIRRAARERIQKHDS